jgi:hypothetical protein
MSHAKIEFDTEAYKTRIFEGPYPSMRALKNACFVPATAAKEFADWKNLMGIDADSKSMIATVSNKLHMDGTHEALKKQLQQFVTGGDPLTIEKLSFTMSPDLKKAFAAVAAQKKEVRVLMYENTRETQAFALKHIFPDTTIKVTGMCRTQIDANFRNLYTKATMGQKGMGLEPPYTSEWANQQDKDMGLHLAYASDWSKQEADIVFVNSTLHYDDKKQMYSTIDKICATGASHVIFANTQVEKSGKVAYYGQRYRGGIIPARVSPTAEFVALMADKGYRLERAEITDATYNVSSGVTIKGRLDDPMQMVFVKN